MLIDMHAHSSAISHCCRATVEEILEADRAVGIDGIVLTNHYLLEYVENGDAAAFARRYTDEYRHAREYGDRVGMRVFFGVEVTARQCGNAHILIYGLPPAFIEEHPEIYNYSQEQMYRAVSERGGTMIQGHPLRRGGTLLDPAFLDGIEANCHPIYEGPCYDRLAPFAAKHGLIMTCGGDYHADSRRVRCGTRLPDFLTGGLDLARYLRETDAIQLVLEEPDGIESYTRVYERGVK